MGSDDDQIAENGRGNELEMSDDLFPKEEHNDTVHVFVEEKSVVNQELSLGDSITEKENKVKFCATVFDFHYINLFLLVVD